MLECPTCGRQFASDATTCPADGTMLRADVTLAADIPIDSLLGRVLDDKYRLDERLGEGGMGTVYRATHLLIERPVAVKVLTPRLVTDDAARERFRREARAAGRLQHSNAVAVTDFGETTDGLGLHRDGVARRPPVARRDGARISARCGACRVADVAGVGSRRRRARSGHHPSRLEAGQHLYRAASARAAHRQGARLRHRQTCHRRR